MKPERQRFVIADHRGIRNINITCWRGHLDNIEVSIPDYLGDLNAMHEVEFEIRYDECEQEKFENALLDVIVRQGGYQYAYQLIHASASQRAEAFLRTLGLWEEP